MDRQAIISFLGEDWTRTEALLKRSLDSDIQLLNSTNDSILSHLGKQMRPMLALLVARLCNGGRINNDCIDLAVASELLHNATLLHDDVADMSDVRRGAATTRCVLGPAASVLVGDYWLASALMKIMPLRCKDAVLESFSNTLKYLAKGEMLQLEKATTADTRMKDYLEIIYCKTASMFESIAESAAYCVDATLEAVSKVREFARSLGIAFQIKDDILDYVGDEHLGKPIGIDLKEKKITLPLLAAMRNGGQEAEIRAKLLQVDSNPEYVQEIWDYVRCNYGIEDACEELERYVEKACHALDSFQDCQEKEFLVELCRYNSYRAI